MKLIYLAGPYRAPSVWGIHRNIEAARSVARELWLMGFAVICPHANTALMDGEGTDAIFLEGDLLMVERCDLLVALPGWESSEGAKGEIHHAAAHRIPTFYWPADRAAIEAHLTAPARWQGDASSAARLLVSMRKGVNRLAVRHLGRTLFDEEAA